jgi:hypothetical protein
MSLAMADHHILYSYRFARRVAPVLIVLSCAGVTRAGAQTIPTLPDPATIKLRLGPFLLNPSLALTNAGVDTNVFYEPDAKVPARDFTITVTAQTDYWLRMGRTWLAGNTKEDLVWYRKFSGERSANNSDTLYWLIPFNRLSIAAGGNWIRARERPGFEIDARSQRTELAGGGAAELRALSKTFLGIRGERRKVKFDQDAFFLGTNLEVELNRTTTTGGATIRHQLTPLTSVSLELAKGQDRFEFTPNRDSDSTRANGSITFSPLALISGSAQFGYRRFTPLDTTVPGYSGSTASVNLSHVARGSTRLGLQILRDIQYSFEIQQPYYLQTGFTASAAQQIYGPVDVEIRGGRHALAYRSRGGTPDPDRVDHIRAFGGGIGYRVGRDLRVGVNVDHQRRTSDILPRSYEGFRYGMAATYGL